MTMHHERKGSQEPSTPEVCHRCRARMGVTQLYFFSEQDASSAPQKRQAWLCDQCRLDVQRDSDDN